MAYGQTYGGSVDETDEEMERRIMAEIAAQAPAASRMGAEPSDEGFDAVIRGLTTAEHSEYSVSPPPAQQRPAEGPRVSQEAATATGLSGAPQASEPRTYDTTPGRRTAGASATGLGSGGAVNMSAIESGIDERNRENMQRWRGQAHREERRQKILRGLGISMAMLGAPQLGTGLVMAGNSVRRDGRDALENRRADIMQRSVDQRAREEQAKQERMAAIERGLQERRLALQEGQLRSLDEHRDAMLGQRGEQFTSREAQDLEQDRMRYEAAAGRARDIAGGMAGVAPDRAPGGGRIAAPGSDEAAALTTDQMETQLNAWANEDDLLVRETREYLRRRGENLNSPEGLAAHYRMVYQARRLPRRARGQYLDDIRASEGAGIRGSASDARGQQQEASRVERYGRERQDQIEWESTVNSAASALQSASDEDLRAAQQWLQGGAARQSISSALAPRAEELGRRIQRLTDIMLKERSGAAVTDQEFARLRSEIGTNWWSSPSSLRNALQEMRNTNARLRNGLRGTYGAETEAAYEQNRGGGNQGASQWRAIGRTADGGIVYENAAGERRVRRAQ